MFVSFTHNIMKTKNLLVITYSELSLIINTCNYSNPSWKNQAANLHYRQKEGEFLSLEFSNDEIPICMLSFKWPSS